MPIGANIELANTFNDWRVRTNEIISFLSGGGSGVVLIGTTVTGNSAITGTFTANTFQAANGSASVPAYAWTSDANSGVYKIATGRLGLSLSGTLTYDISGTRILFSQNAYIGFANTTGTDTAGIVREADGILALRTPAANTTAHGLRLYHTFTDASNFERVNAAWSGNKFFLGTASAGTGSARGMVVGPDGEATLELQTTGTTRVTINSTAIISTLRYLAPNGSVTDPSLTFANQPGTGWYLPSSASSTIDFTAGGTAKIRFSTLATQFVSSYALEWSSGIIGAATDLTLSRLANNQLQQSGSGLALYRMNTTMADGTGTVGQIEFNAATNTGGANESRLAIITVNRTGATATQRGGDLLIYTKPDASASLNQWTFASTGATTLPGTLGTGSTTITGTLGTGNTTITGTLATGNTSISGTLAAGNTSITGTVASGNTTVTGFVSASTILSMGSAFSVNTTVLTVTTSPLTVNSSNMIANLAIRCDNPNGRLVLPVGTDMWAT